MTAVAARSVMAGARTGGLEAGGPERWVLAGVAAELATRLNASAAFIRWLLFLASFVQGTTVFSLYLLAALLLPRGGARRPGWSSLVGVGRFALLFGLLAALNAGQSNTEEIFKSGPAVWAPFAGVLLAAGAALVASGPRIAELDEARCRRQVLGALPVVAIAALSIAGMAAFPDWHWQRILAGAVVVLGLLVALGARRSWLAGAMVVPAAAMAGAVLLVSSTGAQLRGGIGDLQLSPEQYGPEWTTIRRANGDVELDLRRLLVTPGEVTVRAQVSTGSLRIKVPPRAALRAELNVGRGSLYSPGVEGDFGEYNYGLSLQRRLSQPPSLGPRRRPLVRLRIIGHVGLGELTLERGALEADHP